MSSARGLDAFLAGNPSTSSRRAERRGVSSSHRQTDWAGDDDEADGAPSSPPAPTVSSDEEDGGAAGDAADGSEGEDGSDAEDAAAAKKAPARVPRRTRDWEAIRLQQWKAQQGIDAEGGDGEGDALTAAQVTASRKRGRAVLTADEEAAASEEAEKQRRMRALFDRRDGDKLEAFTMKGDQQEGAALGGDAGEEEEVDEAEQRRRREDPWWLEQRAAAKAEREKAKAAETAMDGAALALTATTPVARPQPPRPSFALQPWTEVEAKRALLRFLQPGESALRALRRLGGGDKVGAHSTSRPCTATLLCFSHLPPTLSSLCRVFVCQSSSSSLPSNRRLQTRQKNRRTKPSASGGAGSHPSDADVRMEDEGEGKEANAADEERKAQFLQLTDLCAQSVSEGWLDVYQCTHQQLSEESKRWPPVAAGRQVEEVKGEEKGAEEEADEWVVKESAVASGMQGPYTARELLEELQNGAVNGDAVVRKVGATTWQPLQAMPWWKPPAG